MVLHRESIFARMGHVIYNTIKGFIDDDCYGRASALTFYSLLSIVPVIAVVFGIGKGFGFDRNLEEEVRKVFVDNPQVAEKLIVFANSWLENVRGGLIAGVGTILLLWTVMGLLGNVESALNSIWKVRFSRSYLRRISDYLAVVIIAPLFFITLSSINIFITTHITNTAKQYSIVEALSPFLLSLLTFFPYFLCWVLFSFLYIFMPNTRVYIKTAIIAGVVAGTAFQLWQWFYIQFQVGVASYGAIYGSFAALPLFLVWLQISWVIVLAGAELAVHLENDLFIPNKVLRDTSPREAALYMTYRCLEAFAKGQDPLTDREMATEASLSLNHAQIILQSLTEARILSEVRRGYKSLGYQPARPMSMITMKSVCDAVDKSSSFLAAIPEGHIATYLKSYLSTTEKLSEELSHENPLYPLSEKSNLANLTSEKISS